MNNFISGGNNYVEFNVAGQTNTFKVQWGNFNKTGNQWQAVTLPIPFSTINYSVTFTLDNTGWTEGVIFQTRNYETESFEILANPGICHWIAIGY